MSSSSVRKRRAGHNNKARGRNSEIGIWTQTTIKTESGVDGEIHNNRRLEAECSKIDSTDIWSGTEHRQRENNVPVSEREMESTEMKICLKEETEEKWAANTELTIVQVPEVLSPEENQEEENYETEGAEEQKSFLINVPKSEREREILEMKSWVQHKEEKQRLVVEDGC